MQLLNNNEIASVSGGDLAGCIDTIHTGAQDGLAVGALVGAIGGIGGAIIGGMAGALIGSAVAISNSTTCTK